MYKLCKTAQSARRQRELEQGLLEIMKQELFEKISISSLCEKLSIPRKTFYRYFDSKEGALFALIDHTLLEYESFNGAHIGSGKRTLNKELERFFLFWKNNQVLLDVLQNNDLGGVLIERAINFALSDAVMPRRFLPEDSEEMRRKITMFSICGMLAMILAWHHGGFAEEPSELASVASRLLEKPLFSHADDCF